MKNAILIIGIQGSGKSEFYRRYLQNEYVRINLDTLHTRNKENIAIADCFKKEVNFAVDNTNVTVEERKKYIDAAKANGYKVIGYFMQSKLSECIARNNLRTGKAKVPAKAIAATSNKMVLPSFKEGFDALYFVHNDGEKMTVEEWRTKDEI